MILTLDHLEAAIPAAGREHAALYLTPINASLARYGIDRPERIAAFLANIAHESRSLHRVEEGLSYSSRRLQVVWPRRFPTAEIAESYAHCPERIANRAYAGKIGNGDEASGDGWRFRGRGLIQITGRDNYVACSVDVFNYTSRLLTDPDLLLEPEWAAMSAGWFWHRNRINDLADRGDFDGCCDLVNRGRKTAAEGDAIGYDARLAIYTQAMEMLA